MTTDTSNTASAPQPAELAEQQGDARAQFEAWHCEKFKTRWQTGAPTRDMHNGVYAEKYGPAEQQVRWEAWQAAWQAALAARQPGAQEPITVEAVATIERDSDGDRYVSFLLEGGISELEVGDVLMVADRSITDDDGSGEVYAAPPAQGIDLGPVAAMLRQARLYLQDGLNSQCMNKLDDLQTLIGQRDASPGVGNG